VHSPHGQNDFGESKNTATTGNRVATAKRRDEALMAADLPDHDVQLDYKDQVHRVTPHPEPFIEQYPEDADSREESMSHDIEEENEQEQDDDSITSSVAFASAWIPDDILPSNNSGRGLSSSAIVEMNLQNEQSKRKWIIGVVSILSMLAIILTVLLICRDGQCFKSDDKAIEPDLGVPIEITISPGMYIFTSNLKSLPP